MADLDTGHKSSRSLWICAAVGALALHLGGAAFALTHLKDEDFDDSLGAPAIEVGLEMTSSQVEATDLPPGPDNDASTASPELAEQKAELKDSDLPKDKPTETEDPDRVVTMSDIKKPVEEEEKVATVATAASQASVAAEATATPNIDDAPKADRSVAPAMGTGASAQRIRTTWQKELMAHFERHKRYPSERVMKTAEVVVEFALDRMGRVLSMNVVKGSGDAAFDEAALTMVKKSDPVPQPPALVADEGLTFTVPVVFRVKGKS